MLHQCVVVWAYASPAFAAVPGRLPGFDCIYKRRPMHAALGHMKLFKVAHGLGKGWTALVYCNGL